MKIKIQLHKNAKIFMSLIAFLLSFSSYAQKCNDLIVYRDTKLYNEYDKAFKKYTVNQQAKTDVQKIKTDLLNDTRWATSDAGLTTGIIAQNIKTTCNLISNLLKFNPATGITGTVVSRASITAQKVYQYIETGQTISTLVNDGAEKTGYDLLLSSGNPLGQAVKTAWDLSEDIAKMATMPDDRLKLKEDVKRVLDMIDSQIQKYEQAVNSSSARLSELNEVKTGIDKYLLEYCRPIFYRGSGNSGSTNYGIGGCTWSMQMQNVNISFSLNKQNNSIIGGQLSNDEVENTVSGRCVSGTKFRDTYNQSNSSFSGNSVKIWFSPSPSNHQKCNARFDGTISGNVISGTLYWNRTDQPQAPSIQYTVTMGITMTK